MDLPISAQIEGPELLLFKIEKKDIYDNLLASFPSVVVGLSIPIPDFSLLVLSSLAVAWALLCLSFRLHYNCEFVHVFKYCKAFSLICLNRFHHGKMNLETLYCNCSLEQHPLSRLILSLCNLNYSG